MAVRTQDDAGRDVAQEPARVEQGDAGVGPGEVQDGAAGEEDHHGHQEDGQAGSDGRRQSHGQG